MAPSPLKLDAGSWALLLVLALLWSASFIFIEVAAGSIPVFSLVLIRVGLAALVLHAIVLLSGRAYPRDPGMLGRYAVMGLFNNVLPGLLIVYATPRIGAGAASILNAAVPIFTLILARLATADEKITGLKLAGVLLGAAGVAVMVGPQALLGAGTELLATAAMLLATFCYGLAGLVGRTFRSVDPIVSATCQLSASTLMLAPVALWVDRPWTLPPPGWDALLSAAALAVFSTALAYALFFRLIARAGATNTSLVTLLIPPGAVVLAWAILGELIGWHEAAGMTLIALGLLVTDSRIIRWRYSPRRLAA
jgi:drug/metabolite transporter (DMT)-like permease